MFFWWVYFSKPHFKTQYYTIFHQNGSESGSIRWPIFCVLLFPSQNERKDLKSLDFRSFMVAAAGLEPAASGLWAALMLQSLAVQGFRAFFTPENPGKPEGQTSLLPGTKAYFHGNGSESGSEPMRVYQEMSRWNKEEITPSPLQAHPQTAMQDNHGDHT